MGTPNESEATMDGPKKNRLHGYEVGWFTLLLRMEVATAEQLQAAQARVAHAAIERMKAQRARRSRRRDRGG
ncbi:hypothetical protein EBR56_05430 [bacterium]|nr:hypothetical protein [bacterium]